MDCILFLLNRACLSSMIWFLVYQGNSRVSRKGGAEVTTTIPDMLKDIVGAGPVFGYYLAGVSILALALTFYDKWAARRRHWRISEGALLAVSALGGSLAMLVTMRLLRHKTRKPKFMVGIPVIIAIQLAAYFFLQQRFMIP